MLTRTMVGIDRRLHQELKAMADSENRTVRYVVERTIRLGLEQDRLLARQGQALKDRAA